jgi:hypothetical protein
MKKIKAEQARIHEELAPVLIDSSTAYWSAVKGTLACILSIVIKFRI